MWRAIIMAALVGIGNVGDAQAQTKKELVAKVMQLQQPGIENMGRQIATQNSERIWQAVGQKILLLPADKRQAAAKDVQVAVKRFYDDVEPLLRKRAVELAPSTIAPAYEDRFSEDELKQIITWLESPVSKKFQLFDSEISKTLAEKVVADARSTIEPKMKALEVAVAKRLGGQPGPAPQK